jgi:nitroimidazol reductase NimA-like FMN-containing flavoprotein (pyridoxamine 5'-phosphate oxidase superfamily)
VTDRQDVARELGRPGARELLESATLARLAYNGPDGLPRVIPIGFYWNGERIVVCTATTSPKVQALSVHPDVALTIDVGDTPAAAKSLLVRGFASLETVDGVADEYLAGAKKAMDPDLHAVFEGHVRSMYKQQVRISIEPRWARFYDFSVGPVPAFLTKLAAST